MGINITPGVIFRTTIKKSKHYNSYFQYKVGASNTFLIVFWWVFDSFLFSFFMFFDVFKILVGGAIRFSGGENPGGIQDGLGIT